MINITPISNALHLEFKQPSSHRKGQLLDVHSEKMSEAAFYSALHSAAAGWRSALVDYTTAESVLLPGPSRAPAHYLVLLELDGPPLTNDESRQVGTERGCGRPRVENPGRED